MELSLAKQALPNSDRDALLGLAHEIARQPRRRGCPRVARPSEEMALGEWMLRPA